MIYYFVLEGGWGASLGKRLMGLRVTSQTDDRWWLRVGLRTAVFHVPTFFFHGRRNWRPYPLLSLLLTILLFSTARRGNGWTGVHELLSRTRVVQRNVRAVASAAPKASPADLVPALSSLRRVGPYAVHTMVGETGGGRLFVGIDPILRRHVWIHEVPRTPPVEAGRRDTSRPGRLLARGTPIGDGELGRVRGAEGRAIPDSAADVRLASGASCALEPGDRARCLAREDRHTLSLAHVWRRADGHLVLLDFRGPPGRAGRQSDSHPVELLAAVSTRACAPTKEPAAPLSGTTLLHRLASGAPPALADVKAELLRLASIPSRPSRIRRALPMVMAAMPMAALS